MVILYNDIVTKLSICLFFPLLWVLAPLFPEKKPIGSMSEPIWTGDSRKGSPVNGEGKKKCRKESQENS
jgi:hypothetical protein